MRIYVWLCLTLLLCCIPIRAHALRLYTQAQYTAARNSAVATAKKGDLKTALLSLKRLHKLEPGNHGATNDYITILIWDGQYKQALDIAAILDLHQVPEYVLRALVTAAEHTKQSEITDTIIKTYISRYFTVPQDAPQHISGLTLSEVARLGESAGHTQTSLSIFKNLHEANPQDQETLVEYIAALSRDKRYDEALALFPQMELATSMETAENRELQQVRQGHLWKAENKLEKLLAHDPSDQDIRNHYITVLCLNKRYGQALALLPTLQVDEMPEYALRSLIVAADKESQPVLSQELIAIYIHRFLDRVPGKDTKRVSAKELERFTRKIGMNQTALSIVQNLHERDPHNQDILVDYISALGLNLQYENSLKLLPLLDLEKAPEFVIDTLLESARKTGDTKAIALLLTLYQRRFSLTTATLSPIILTQPTLPENSIQSTTSKERPTPPPEQKSQPRTNAIEQGLRHLEVDEYVAALTILAPLYLSGNTEEQLLLAMATLYSHTGNHIQASYVFQQLLLQTPNSTELYRQLVFSLSKAGAAFRAQAHIEQKPELFSDAEKDPILADTLAVPIRWARYMQNPEKLTASLLQHNVQSIESEISQLRHSQQGVALERLQVDYLVALQDNSQSETLLNEYQEYIARGITTPDYALRSVADAYLDQRQPETARDIYQTLLSRDPNSFSLKEGLFYAYFDNSQYRDGIDLSTITDEDTPLWRKNHTGSIIKNNDEKLQSAILEVKGLLYSDQLKAAQENLEAMLAIAPYNSSLRANLSLAYRWRGWPQKALDESAIGHTIDPDDVEHTINAVRSLMDLSRYKEAGTKLTELRKDNPQNRQIMELQRDYDLKMRRLFVAWVDTGGSTSDNSDYGTADLSIESYLYDRYYNYSLRPYVHQFFSSSDFTEGTGSYERVAIGTQFDSNRSLISVELSGSYSGDSDPGFSISGEHSFTDHWSLSLAYDSFSINIPTRAYFHGITGPSYRASTIYRFHEATRFSLSYEFLDFSDTNQRNSWSLTMRQQLLNTPRFKIFLTPSVYHSSNSEQGGPYFNPITDTSYDLSLSNEWILYRFYERSFRHTLEFNIGQYDQEGFGINPTYALLYTHMWDINQRLSFSYGAGVRSNYYDGEEEQRLSAFGSLRWVF